MTISEMFSQSVYLTILGMGVVFAFLIILIGAMKLVEIFVRITGSDIEVPNSVTNGSSLDETQNQAVIAAIAVALKNKKEGAFK